MGGDQDGWESHGSGQADVSLRLALAECSNNKVFIQFSAQILWYFIMTMWNRNITSKQCIYIIY